MWRLRNISVDGVISDFLEWYMEYLEVINHTYIVNCTINCHNVDLTLTTQHRSIRYHLSCAQTQSLGCWCWYVPLFGLPHPN